MTSRYDEALDEFVNQYGVPEDKAAMFRSNALRTELEDAKKQAAEAAQAKAELDKYKRQPKVAEALAEFGVDVNALNKRDRTIVDNHFPEFKDAPEKESVATFLQEWGFDARVPEGEAGEQPNAAAVVNQSLSAPIASGFAQITNKDFASWDTGRQRKFMKDHPNAYDALLRGETVQGVTA